MAFVIAAADVVQDQAVFAQVTGGEFLLDARLPIQQPVHGLVQVVLGGIGDRQLLGQGRGVPFAGGSQFRARMQQTCCDHGHDQIALATTLGGEEGIQAELAHRPQDGFDVAVGESLVGAEQILRGDQGFVLQEAAEGIDFWLGPVGEVGQSALAGFRAFAPTFAEEDRGRGVAVGDGLDVHGSIIR